MQIIIMPGGDGRPDEHHGCPAHERLPERGPVQLPGHLLLLEQVEQLVLQRQIAIEAGFQAGHPQHRQVCLQGVPVARRRNGTECDPSSSRSRTPWVAQSSIESSSSVSGSGRKLRWLWRLPMAVAKSTVPTPFHCLIGGRSIRVASAGKGFSRGGGGTPRF